MIKERLFCWITFGVDYARSHLDSVVIPIITPFDFENNNAIIILKGNVVLQLFYLISLRTTLCTYVLRTVFSGFIFFRLEKTRFMFLLCFRVIREEFKFSENFTLVGILMTIEINPVILGQQCYQLGSSSVLFYFQLQPSVKEMPTPT